jgi:hypothetical protein
MEKLSNHFSNVAVKPLSEVEVNLRKSNQHELQGIQRLREIFGSDRRTIDSTCLYLAHDEADRLSQDGQLTWYDSRKNDPTRSAEFRLYYKSSNERLILFRQLERLYPHGRTKDLSSFIGYIRDQQCG